MYMYMYIPVVGFVQIPDCSLWVIHQLWMEILLVQHSLLEVPSHQYSVSSPLKSLQLTVCLIYNYLSTNIIFMCYSFLTGSGGSVLYTGLNPNRGRSYTLEITGTLPGGTTVLLNRDVHLGKEKSRFSSMF